MIWQSKSFNELNNIELYNILRIRQQVFVVEQNCPYLDCDNLDLEATHIIASEQSNIAAYMRVIKPNVISANVILGRVLTSIDYRKTGLGRQTIEYSINFIEKNYSGIAIEISAQAHLINFYERFGFVTSGNEYMEDGIPHIKMIRQSQ